MPDSLLKGAAWIGLATLALAFAAASQPSAAQDGKPAAAAPPAAGAGADAAQVQKGRGLFADFACGSCHSLADAGATGHVGPSLDGDASLTPAFVANRVKNGQGAMPAFGDQLNPEEIAAVAAYVTQVASK